MYALLVEVEKRVDISKSHISYCKLPIAVSSHIYLTNPDFSESLLCAGRRNVKMSIFNIILMFAQLLVLSDSAITVNLSAVFCDVILQD